MRDKKAVEELFSAVKLDQVIHLAARAGVRPSIEDPVLYQEVNVVGTTRVLEAARSHKISKVTIASSSSMLPRKLESAVFQRPIQSLADISLRSEQAGLRGFRAMCTTMSTEWILSC